MPFCKCLTRNYLVQRATHALSGNPCVGVAVSHLFLELCMTDLSFTRGRTTVLLSWCFVRGLSAPKLFIQNFLFPLKLMNGFQPNFIVVIPVANNAITKCDIWV